MVMPNTWKPAPSPQGGSVYDPIVPQVPAGGIPYCEIQTASFTSSSSMTQVSLAGYTAPNGISRYQVTPAGITVPTPGLYLVSMQLQIPSYSANSVVQFEFQGAATSPTVYADSRNGTGVASFVMTSTALMLPSSLQLTFWMYEDVGTTVYFLIFIGYLGPRL